MKKMMNVEDFMAYNANIAAEYLKANGGHIKFSKNTKVCGPFDVRPYVLTHDNGYDDIMPEPVNEARLNDRGEIEILCDRRTNWISINRCVSATANKVLKAIEKIYGK